MECPYCAKEMQQGILRANGIIRWMPNDEKEPLNYLHEKYEKQNIMLFPLYWDDTSMANPNETVAFICFNCR